MGGRGRNILIGRLAGVALLSTAAVFVGCGGKQTSAKSLEYVSPSEAQALVDGRGRIIALSERTGVWVDPRTEREYDESHIPGAIHLPYQSLNELHADRLRGADLVVVYGSGYNDAKAQGMSKRLIELGYKRVHTLEGGLRAWTDAGMDVETSQPADG